MSHFLSEYLHGHGKIHYTEMREIYISLSLRALAIGVGGIFVPLFLFDIGYSLFAIAGFYIFSMMLRLPLQVVAGKLIGSIGAKHTMTVSYVNLLLHFLTLYGMQFFPWLWPLAAGFLAAELALFWVAFDLQLSTTRSKDRASQQVGMTIILKRTFMALGPVIGGLVATAFGVEFTLLLAALFLSFSAYPLMKTPDNHRQYFQLRDLNFNLGKDTLSHIAWQISGVVSTYLWPLWLLFVLGDYSQVGLVITLSVVIGISVAFWVGKLGDKGYNDLLLKIGSGIKSLSHWLRLVASSFGLAVVASAANDLADNFIRGPFSEEYFEAADKGDRFLYIMQKNLTTAFGKLLGWVLLLVLAFILSEMAALKAMFIIAAITVPAIMWVSRRNVEDGA